MSAGRSVRFAPLWPMVVAACSSAGDAPGLVERPSTDAGATDASAFDASDATSAADAGTNGLDASAADDAAGSASPSNDSGALACGPAPARFTILSGADAGLVRDNVTLLVWMADSAGGGEPPQTQPDAAHYCAGRGMRLPTESEAQALAASYAPCAFGQWSTWTSTAVGSGDAWVVDYLGDTSPQVADNFPSAVLCVRDAED